MRSTTTKGVRSARISMRPKNPRHASRHPQLQPPRHPKTLTAGLVAAGVLLAAAAAAARLAPAPVAGPAASASSTAGAGATPASPPAASPPAAREAAAAPSRAAALAAFGTVRQVLQHPRCQNCHIPGDAPLQFDAGVTHAQYVKRGPQGAGAPGLPCSTCHSTSNPPASYGPHAPPGAPNWRLPAPERKMVFIGLSAGDLCATIKDPARNGGRDMAALIEHVSHDKLVLWGWDPGAGRAPVPVAHEAFVASFKTWVAGGAPCPPPAARSR